jgi:cytochrome b involved in lipid metabolism
MKIYAIATGAAVALALVIAPPASAAAKEGAACKKAGQSSTVSGRKFTCVKKGSKLVWNKGVAVKKAPTAAATPVASAASAGYTMDKVKANNSATNCWSAINGNVYDLTRWISSHPGGSGAIRSLCGTDGSAEFNGQHGGSGTPQARLAGYLLGPLAK